jgi:ABC-type lipoprotein export system ATPase subunit
MLTDPLISVTSITKTYSPSNKQRTDVLTDVTFSVNTGEFVALTGPSGSGKSTLLQIIGGLDRPTSGDVVIEGTTLFTMSEHSLTRFRLRNIGFVFQFFYLQPFLTLEENIAIPGMFADRNAKELRERARYLANVVGVSDRLDHVPKELSGGQIQRAAIARALFNNPHILLADEPTGNLDSKNSEMIIQLFDTIRRELGTTIVIVTHDSMISAKVDRTLTLLDGVLR